ncbi:MAG: nucleoside-triphosphatase [Bacteroidota bacterium]
MRKRITIITGQIGSGKTTYLEKLLLSPKEAAGILQISKGNRRYFVDIGSSETVELTSEDLNSDNIQIGRFIFNKSIFSWANEKLQKSFHSKAVKQIIVDEYGPLEFKGKGFEPIFSEILNYIKKKNDVELIVVVRNSLLERFLNKFNLKDEKVEIVEISKSINRF